MKTKLKVILLVPVVPFLCVGVWIFLFVRGIPKGIKDFLYVTWPGELGVVQMYRDLFAYWPRAES